MTPKWQRARIIDPKAFKEVQGCECWVAAKRPVMGRSTTFGGTILPESPILDTNVYTPSNRMCLGIEDIELLADFADDVPMLTWKQFLEQCRTAKENPS